MGSMSLGPTTYSHAYTAFMGQSGGSASCSHLKTSQESCRNGNLTDFSTSNDFSAKSGKKLHCALSELKIIS